MGLTTGLGTGARQVRESWTALAEGISRETVGKTKLFGQFSNEHAQKVMVISCKSSDNWLPRGARSGEPRRLPTSGKAGGHDLGASRAGPLARRDCNVARGVLKIDREHLHDTWTTPEKQILQNKAGFSVSNLDMRLTIILSVSLVATLFVPAADFKGASEVL